jgi:glyoxylase-like metal-dependent hydrolase (beta-lactamase superfamily II)
MMPFTRLVLLLAGLLAMTTTPAWAALELQRVTDNVYAIVGEMGNRTKENLGNNATFGFVVTPAGVVLIDVGGTYQGAQRIHQVIRQVTDQPVITVINSGGQDHRWLGNGYFRSQGAEIIASQRAVEDQKARQQDQFFMLGNLVGDEGLKGTDAVYADKTFESELELNVGGIRFELHHAGAAHTPGDSFIWLPQQKVMFTGDIVYTERMLGVTGESNSRSWLEVYQAMAAYQPQHVVPGHGHATTLERADADTYGYLNFLRQAVADFMQAGGDLSDISQVDQSRYNYLHNHDILAGRNAQKVYTELEWE